MARNKTRLHFPNCESPSLLILLESLSAVGEFSSSSFSISEDCLIFAERAGGKVESVEKYWLEAGQAGMLSLERDWMKTWPCKLSYTNTGEKREARGRSREPLLR